MDKINIETSNNLSGTVKISGSKNSSLPILAATVLWGSQYKIKNVPEIIETNYNLNEIKLIKIITANTVKNLKRTYYLYVGKIR